ncbi:hypothetical protein SO802_009821 [Lithocarpus litseifolius]|uniref:Disease resistance protein RGA3 n=1 Tax=Lithocarpus litseifolius TaxID=425828 RepID=A0AAW2DFG5_9ROSI
MPKHKHKRAEDREERPRWVSMGKLWIWDLGLRGLWRLGLAAMGLCWPSLCRSAWRMREADGEGVRRETRAGRVPAGPQGAGMGQGSLPRTPGRAGMGKGNNHAGRGQRSHPQAPPRSIAIPTPDIPLPPRLCMLAPSSFHEYTMIMHLLHSLLLQEIKLACGVKAELGILNSTVSTIQAMLLDAENQGSHNYEVRDWLRKLKDLFFDADDLLDDFSTEALLQKMVTGSKITKEVRIFFSSSNQLAYSLKMGHRIKAIRERLNAIADDRMKFQFIEIPIEPQVNNRNRETYSFVLEEYVAGRDDDKKEIMKLLFDTDVVENVSIIPIVGIGGLGKTTLAQLIYNDENVKNNFELKFWICVSDNFDVKQILESMKVERHEEKLEILQNQLPETLNGKKILPCLG